MDLSEPQKSIYIAFQISGLNTIETFCTEKKIRYVQGTIGNKKYIFSHKGYKQYILSCNAKTLIATNNPMELRLMIEKIIRDPTSYIEKSPISLL